MDIEKMMGELKEWQEEKKKLEEKVKVLEDKLTQILGIASFQDKRDEGEGG